MKKKRKNEPLAALSARVREELAALDLPEPEASADPAGAADPAGELPWENADGSLWQKPASDAAAPSPEEQMAAWERQAAALKELAPDFDLAAECADPVFRGLLDKGLTVKQAFILQYFDRLLGAAVRLSADETERRVTEELNARGMRPPENGTAGTGPFLLGGAAGGLTKRQRAEIAERVRRGEKVRL